MLLGRYGPLEDAVPAILIVERLHFDLQTANEIPSQLSDYAVLLENDSYCTATAHLPGPSVKFTLIAPATDVVSQRLCRINTSHSCFSTYESTRSKAAR
jgi:hypothetical protein